MPIDSVERVIRSPFARITTNSPGDPPAEDASATAVATRRDVPGFIWISTRGVVPSPFHTDTDSMSSA